MPMDQLCCQITSAVKKLKETYKRQIVTKNGRQVREGLEDYVERILYPELRRQFSGNDDIALGVIGLMAYLGPPEAELPPAVLRDELIGHTRQYASDLPDAERSKRLVELALAYGCGWKRSAKSGIDRWDDTWGTAVTELTEIADNFVVQTLKILNDTVRECSESAVHNQIKLDRYERKGYVGLIVAEFIGERFNPGNPEYKRYRTIHTWQPLKGNLYVWLQGAINGRGTVNVRGKIHLQANKLKNGLLFPRLQEEGRLDVGKVAFQRCTQCAHETEYDGTGFCNKCQEKTFVTFKVLPIVPGVYAPRQFWHCPGHYYEFESPECPHCRNKGRPQRPTTLLVY